ncbi:MAG: GH92 family glycosyl hydrolase [Pirellulales bacterium]|nr:GH92 family glycosyl hydrolase [Pirellulales bacterium]
MFFKWFGATAIISITALGGFSTEPRPVDSVNPLIGTNAHGHVYPGATVPFGMVQLSPDTRLGTWDGCSGYHYSDPAILGFSHTHLSGTGCGDLGDIRVTPLSGEVAPAKDGYRLAFSHENEKARPGYYSVVFSNPKIKAELTAMARAGFHRYHFPEGQPAHLAFDLARGIMNNPAECEFKAESNTVVSGYRRSHGWAADKTFYFVAEFSRPFDAVHIEVDGKPVAEGTRAGKGTNVQAVLDFNDPAKPVLMKIGLSAVSVEGARKNLAAEIPDWDFGATAAAAGKAWNDVLGKIEIETGDPAVRETFYTALYHACLAPTLFNDADGTYRGLDHQVHPNEGFQNYCTFSLWDTFRAEHPLLTIIQPQRVDDFVGSMLAHYRQFNQHCLPVWSLAGNETWCMIGIHSIPVIAEAYAKGFRRFDAEAAYQAMRDSMMQDRNFLNEYRQYGYIPTGKDKQSVSRSLEYAYDDWCIADMARRLGKMEDAKLFAERGANYRHLLNPANGFMQGKTAEGRWREPFDPRQLVWEDYTEATSWNYTWFVPQDVPGLIGLIGGDRKFIDKLDQMYAEQSGLLANIPDLTGLVGQYVHGNEPCHHVAYLYNYAGAPWKTQARVRDIMKTLYSNQTDGICGNDDCGQMSAWYVLSAMGFYPVNPAAGVYVLGSPAVDRATIRLDLQYQKGREFTIIAENNSPKNVYIQSATLNGKPISRSWLTHDELTAGGELVLKMGPEPNPDWAKDSEDRPGR